MKYNIYVHGNGDTEVLYLRLGDEVFYPQDSIVQKQFDTVEDAQFAIRQAILSIGIPNKKENA